MLALSPMMEHQNESLCSLRFASKVNSTVRHRIVSPLTASPPLLTFAFIPLRLSAQPVVFAPHSCFSSSSTISLVLFDPSLSHLYSSLVEQQWSTHEIVARVGLSLAVSYLLYKQLTSRVMARAKTATLLL